MALGIAPSDADKLDRINWFTELIYQAHCLYCIRNRKRAVSKDKFNKFYSKLTVSDLERINNAIKEAEMPDWLVEMQRGKEKNSEVVKKK